MKFVAVLGLIFVLMGCGSDNEHVSAFNKNGENLTAGFSDMDFQGGSPVFVSIIKLTNPALLTTAKKKKKTGEYIFDENLKNAILQEQEDFEAKLAAISTDIKILFRYRMVLNAIAVEAPQELAAEINDLPFDFIEPNKIFSLPTVVKTEIGIPLSTQNLEEKNSMTSIGVDKIHNLLKALNESGELVPVKGQGVKVGIIDTGIDYTHKMLGGSGSVEEYKAIDSVKGSASFPNAKVVGGRDFVGANFSTSSHLYSNHVPVPDENPIDYDGHGTHVAGTVGGLGDGVKTYNGAAPEAELYALKVFGDGGGSTADTVVIAALEYSVDPNGDLKTDDRLDVINMSLGGGYGEQHSLYSIALKNLQKGGVVAVASAGNSGAVPNITGAPASSQAALSVAASIDYSEHNITFAAVKATSSKGLDLLAESIEASVTVPLEGNAVKANVFYIGLAKGPLSDEEKKSLKGKVAFIDRGEVSFVQKIETAISGGAIGALVANNKEEEGAFVMGGDVEEKLSISAFMISKEDGDALKKALEEAEVTVGFGGKIIKPELINTITSFSSQGPRNIDAGLKPEITAPGQQIISASVGTGDEGVKLNGTSMSGPHIAGVAALLVQYKRKLSAKEIKSIIMSTSKDMFDEKGEQYPISRKGAGLVQAYKAATTGVVMKTQALALGKLSIRNKRKIFKKIKIKNISKKEASYSLAAVGDKNVQLSFSEKNFTVRRGKTKVIKVEIDVTAPKEEVLELNAFIEVRQGRNLEARVPVLAVINKDSAMMATNLNFTSSGSVEVQISNRSKEAGQALIFNLIAEDIRKENATNEIYTSACDIQSSGYRVVEREGKDLFQVAVKLYNPLTGWETCDVYVDLDYNGDGKPEQEIKGSKPSDWPKLEENDQLKDLPVSSLIFDSKKYAQITDAYAAEVAKQGAEEPERDFTGALLGVNTMTAYRSSTVAVVEIPVESMTQKNLKVRVSTSYNNGYNVNRSDVLDDDGKEWKDVDLTEGKVSFSKMPEFAEVPGKSTSSVSMSSGSESRDLVVYFPRNRYILREKGVDRQSQILRVSNAGETELP